MSLRYLQREGTPPPPPVADPDDTFRDANRAFARSMPVHRLLDNGMSYPDATALHRMAEADVPWIDAGTSSRSPSSSR